MSPHQIIAPISKNTLFFSLVCQPYKILNVQTWMPGDPKVLGEGALLPISGIRVGGRLKQFPVLGGSDSFLKIAFNLYKLTKVQYLLNIK